jgi:hypothetical protein
MRRPQLKGGLLSRSNREHLHRADTPTHPNRTHALDASKRTSLGRLPTHQTIGSQLLVETLKPLSKVHGVAVDGVRLMLVTTHSASSNGTGGDPDADAQPMPLKRPAGRDRL